METILLKTQEALLQHVDRTEESRAQTWKLARFLLAFLTSWIFQLREPKHFYFFYKEFEPTPLSPSLSVSLSLSLIVFLEVTALLTGFHSHQSAPPSRVLAPTWQPFLQDHSAGQATQLLPSAEASFSPCPLHSQGTPPTFYFCFASLFSCL